MAAPVLRRVLLDVAVFLGLVVPLFLASVYLLQILLYRYGFYDPAIPPRLPGVGEAVFSWLLLAPVGAVMALVHSLAVLGAARFSFVGAPLRWASALSSFALFVLAFAVLFFGVDLLLLPIHAACAIPST